MLRTSQGELVSRPGAPTLQSYQLHRVELLDLLHDAVKGTFNSDIAV